MVLSNPVVYYCVLCMATLQDAVDHFFAEDLKVNNTLFPARVIVKQNNQMQFVLRKLSFNYFVIEI